MVDPATGNVYAAWSDFHANGCNVILFSRSTDHGATFSHPLKISSGVCINQGPSIAIGPTGQVYVAWEAFANTPVKSAGAAFVSSTNLGKSFSKARVVVSYKAFRSGQFSGNGARECGDAPFNCPTGFTFPRFDLASPYLATDNVNGTLVMAFQVAQASGQGQIEFAFSTNGGGSWSKTGAGLATTRPGTSSIRSLRHPVDGSTLSGMTRKVTQITRPLGLLRNSATGHKHPRV